ncbi:arylsulfotransferase family protein [Amycolatopsis nigrescens]|uniref:arylsulfotransferase family protein n=1 Tax=Amycolatopsis nigrescens TaxID=381445 RepID=UPI0003714B71|nr:arylsulfotransferase family protein [Amycolatopsis nigrescens]
MLRRIGLVGAVAGAANLITVSPGAAASPGAVALPKNLTGVGISDALRGIPAVDKPQMTVLVDRPGTARGQIYYNYRGMVIADQHGITTSFQPSTQFCTDFRLQTYRGRPLLTWWERVTGDPSGGGVCKLADGSFTLVDSIGPLGPLTPDLHEFVVTPWNTALITVYQDIPYDLSPIGGPKQGRLFDSLWLEVDIATKTVLHQWRASDHIPLTDTYARLPEKLEEPFDYFHINSINPDVDGNILISARHTSAVYKIDRRGRRVLWTMGGKSSDYQLDGDASFSWQHDVQAVDAHTLRLFDNASDGTVVDRPHSRVIWVRRDPRTRKVSLVREWAHPDGVSSPAMGNAQRLPNGNTFVGWGWANRLSEFDRRGRLVFDATLPEFCYRSYRFAEQPR